MKYVSSFWAQRYFISDYRIKCILFPETAFISNNMLILIKKNKANNLKNELKIILNTMVLALNYSKINIKKIKRLWYTKLDVSCFYTD